MRSIDKKRVKLFLQISFRGDKPMFGNKDQYYDQQIQNFLARYKTKGYRFQKEQPRIKNINHSFNLPRNFLRKMRKYLIFNLMVTLVLILTRNN